MKTFILSILLAFSFSVIGQTSYCVVSTGRTVMAGEQFYIHSAIYQDSTVDLTKRINKDKELITMADVIFYIAKQGWELQTINQYDFNQSKSDASTLPRQTGEYFIIVFRKDD